MSLRSLCNIALMALASIPWAPTAARAQDTLTVIGATKLSLPDQSTSVSSAVYTIAIPVTIGPAAARVLPRLRVRQVQWNGRQLPAGGIAFSLVLDSTGSPALPSATLLAVIDSSIARRAGEHTVILEAVWPAASGGATRSQLISLGFLTPAAELRTGGTRRIVHTRYPLIAGREEPQALLLDEVGRRAALVPTQTERRAELLAADGTPTGARLRITLPARIGPNSQELAPVHVEGTPPLGKSTATISVASPGLATGVTELSVEVITRPTVFVILVVIALGVFAGYRVRVRMEEDRLRHLADAAVNREIADASDVARAVKDPEYLKRLTEVMRVLNVARQDPAATPDALNTAIQKATTDRTAILAEMNTRSAELTTTISGWIEALGAPSNYEGRLGKEVEKVRELLEGLLVSVRSGMLVSTEAMLKQKLPDVKAALSNAISEWSTGLQQDLAGVGEWPESDYTQAVAGVAEHAQTIAASISAGSTMEQFRTHLPMAGQASRRQRQVIVLHAVPRLLSHVRSVHLTLVGLAARLGEDANEYTASLASVQDALIEATREMNRIDPETSSLVAFGEAMTRARARFRKAFAIALKHVPEAERPRVQAHVEAKQFTAAAQGLADHLPAATRTARRARGAAGAPVSAGGRVEAHSRPVDPTSALPTVDPAVAGLTISWSLPEFVMAGVPAAITLAVLRNGTALLLPSIKWLVDGVDAGSANQPTIVITADRAGNVAIEARVRDSGSGLEVTGRQTILVGPSPREAARLHHAAAERIENRQSLVYGSIIVATGAFIFAPLELTWGQTFFLPLLWGFTTDVGLARVRELVTPLNTKALTVP